MRLDTYLPSAPLRSFVKCYIIVDCQEEMLNSMLPDTSLVMGFRYKGVTQYLSDHVEHRLPFAVVAGLRKSIQLMKDGNDTANLLVVFHPAGAAAFLKEPLHELFGEVVSLHELSGHASLNEVEDRLCSAPSDRIRIQVVERFLLNRLTGASGDALMAAAMQLIQDRKGLVRVEELAGRFYISVDAFEKRFRRMTGASPKQFSNIVRMHAAIDNLRHTSIVKAALNAGYYDQAHFTKDFKLFTGQTPTEYLKHPLP